MNEGYFVVKCHRCNSTSQLMLKGRRNDVFLCPVCLEGEIQYKVKNPCTQMSENILNGLQNIGPCIATPVKLSTN